MPVNVKRQSDQKVSKFDLGPNNKVKELKEKLKATFPPHYEHGCRLIYNGKVMKSIHRLKHYKVQDGDTIIMDDSKNWSSSSSSSDSDR